MNDDAIRRLIATIKPWLSTGSINLFGLPFAGKDTHGRELATLFDAPLLGGGDILRNSIIPPHVKTALDAGLLVPSNEYISIITPFLSKAEYHGGPLILSSVGRWIGEEAGVVGALEASNHPLKAVFYLALDHSTIWERWRHSQERMDRGVRAEDAEAILEIRFKEFEEKTLPVIEYYRQKGLLIEVDSRQSKEDVLLYMLQELAKKAADNYSGTT